MRDGDDQELGRTVGGGGGVAIAIQPNEELLRAERRLVERRIEIAEEQLRDLRDDRDDRQLATRLKARQDRLRIAG
jgi:hypothetical protein